MISSRGLAESFSDCTSYELELLEAEVLGDAAYTVGFEHTSASVNGVPTTYSLRATQIYRREERQWKVAHRHGARRRSDPQLPQPQFVTAAKPKCLTATTT